MISFFKDNKRNHIWLSLQFLVTVSISLVTLKLNLLNFGAEVFGYWILVASLWGFGRVLDFGLNTSLVKFVAEFYKKDKNQLKFLLSSCLLLILILGLAMFILISVIGHMMYFSSNKLISVKYYQSVHEIFFILGASFYINYTTNFIKSVFEGMSNFIIPSILSIVNNILIFISVLITFLLDLEITSLAIFFLLSSLIFLSLFIISYKIKYEEIEISWKYIKFSMLKRIFSFSLAIQGATIFGSLIDPIIKYLIGSLTNIGAVSVYEIARRFVTAITGLFNTTFRTILPKASTLFTKEEYRNFLYTDSMNLSRLGIIYSGTVYGIGALFIPQVILLLFGYKEAASVFLILAIPESINNFGYSIYNFLIGIGKAHFIVLVQFINVTIITLSVFLGLTIFKNTLGLYGYGLSVALVSVLMLLIIRRIADISVRRYLNSTNIYKLILIVGLILTATIMIAYSNFEIYYITISFGLISIPIFYSDLKIIINYIYSAIIIRKNV